MMNLPNISDFIVTLDIALFMLAGAALGGLVRYIRFLNRPVSLTPVRSHWQYIIGGAVLGLILFFLGRRFGWTAPSWDWILVAFLGAAVGLGELSSRYRDEPIKAILSVPATIYVLLNATAAVLALVLGRHFGFWEKAEEPIAWAQVLTAGLGAMVLLRSSVFQIRVGDQDVAVGPSSFLQSVIDAADRAVDRVRAQERAWAVARVMEGVSSTKAMAVLPSYISALMQNLNPTEQGSFDTKIEKLKSGSESDQVKALILGLVAMNYTGEGVLRAAVESLAAEIRHAAEETSNAAVDAAVTARQTQAATQGVLAAMRTVVSKVTGKAGVQPEVSQAAEAAKESAVAAETAASETLAQTLRTAEAAQNTTALATAAEQTLKTQAQVAPTATPLAALSGLSSWRTTADRSAIRVSSDFGADELLGAAVVDREGRTVGTIEDLLIDADGTVTKAVIRAPEAAGSQSSVVELLYLQKQRADGGFVIDEVPAHSG